MNSLGYILLTVVMTFIILFGYNYALKKSGHQDSTKRTVILTVGLLLWFLYIFLISSSGFLQDYSLPPRFPLLLVVPAFVFIGLVFYRYRDSSLLDTIPLSWPIYYQTFRVVIESLFVGSVALGVLHPEVTFKGYNYDILFGFSAPIIGYLVFQTKLLPKKIALFWNFLGLAIIAGIIVLFTTTTYAPELWGAQTTLAKKEMMTFPFTLVPAFLMPSAVCMHVLSIIQLKKEKKALLSNKRPKTASLSEQRTKT